MNKEDYISEDSALMWLINGENPGCQMLSVHYCVQTPRCA